MSRIYLLAVSSLLTYLFSAVTAAQQPAPRTHSIGAKGEVKAAVRWEPSGAKYSNATELVVARKMTMRAAPDDKDGRPAARRAGSSSRNIPCGHLCHVESRSVAPGWLAPGSGPSLPACPAVR